MKAVIVAAQDGHKVWHLFSKAPRGSSTNEQ